MSRDPVEPDSDPTPSPKPAEAGGLRHLAEEEVKGRRRRTGEALSEAEPARSSRPR